MAQQIINVGNVANDGDGDPIRTAFQKTNDNFTQLFNIGGITGIANGTSNIAIVQDSTVSISASNIANVLVVSGTGATVQGTFLANSTVSATGNIIAGGLFIGDGSQLSGVVSSAPAALITGTTLSSNVVNSSLTSVGTLTTLSVAGNVTGGNLNSSGTVSASGNVIGLNITSLGLVNATGNLAGGNVNTTGDISAGGNAIIAGNITGSYFIGNGSLLTGFTVSSNAALLTWNVLSSNVVSSSLTSVGNLNNLVVSNALGGSGNVSANNISLGSEVIATGNITGGNIITLGSVSATSVSTTGDINGANITANVTNGNIAAGNINATNTVTGTIISASGNVRGGNITTGGQVSAAGNITAPNFIGNIATSAQPAITSVGTLTSLTVSGNIGGGNINTGGNVTGSYFIGSVVGNVQGNLLLTGNTSEVIFNDDGAAGSSNGLTFNKTTNALTVIGNATAANINTSGLITATGNIATAANLIVNGDLAYLNVNTLAVETPIFSTGRNASNQPLLSTTTTDRGTQMYYFDTAERSAFVGYQSSSGKMVAATRATVLNGVVTVATYGNFVVGTLEGSAANITGNINAGNVSATGNISATGPLTGSAISVSGNVTGGNLVTTGTITTTGTVTAVNHTGTTVSVTGNVSGGNVISSALLQSASLSVTGNTATVTSANYAIGYRDLPQITTFGTLATTDGGKHYYGSGTITVPTDATSLAVGTTIAVVASAATTISPAGGVTIIWAGQGSTGARTLAQYGMATLIKVAANTWYISGTGIS